MNNHHGKVTNGKFSHLLFETYFPYSNLIVFLLTILAAVALIHLPPNGVNEAVVIGTFLKSNQIIRVRLEDKIPEGTQLQFAQEC